MKHIILVMAGALLLAACTVASVQGQPYSGLRTVQSAAQNGCEAGQHVADNVPGIMRVSLFAVEESLPVLPFVDQGHIVGDYAVPLLAAAKAGEVAHWEGSGMAEVIVHYPNENAMPKQVAYLGGKNIARGVAPVQKVGPGIFDIKIPISGGEWLGYAAVLLPRGAFITPHMRAWVCVTTNFELVDLPQLTGGPYKGKPNVVCGLPGSRSGETLLAEKAQAGALWELFPLIAKREGG